MSKAHKQQTSRATRFTCNAPSAQAVFLAGIFNGWDPAATPMIKDAKGNWDVALALPPGRYEFKFVVDGQWCCEPGCDGTDPRMPQVRREPLRHHEPRRRRRIILPPHNGL